MKCTSDRRACTSEPPIHLGLRILPRSRRPRCGAPAQHSALWAARARDAPNTITGRRECHAVAL
eukprot:11475881-Alexandrium_andersonii.AAC.1